jgi:hypothetical protein
MIIGDRYFIDDPETGLYEVSKEYYEAYNKFMRQAFKDAIPDISKAAIGKPIIFGTAGSLEDSDFKTIFFNPDKFKHK